MSKLTDAMLQAYTKGYRVVDNQLISPTGAVRKTTTSRDGYLRFTTRLGEGYVQVFLHRLVAYEKFGDVLFSEGMLVRHKDGNPGNNLPDNILLGTNSDNMMDKPKEVRDRAAVYASSFIKIHDHDLIRATHQENQSYKNTMEVFGITSKGTLHFILNKSISANSLVEKRLIREVHTLQAQV